MNEVGMKQSAVQNTDFTNEFDSSLVENVNATASGVSGNASTGAGALLLRARQAKDWTVFQVAEQLKLSPRQVTALEMNQYDQLPQMVIVRGFIRSYAKLLKIDAQDVLSLLPESMDSAASVSVFKPVLSTPFLESRSSLMGRQDNNVKYLIGAAVLAVLALSFYVLQRLESEGMLKKWFSTAPVVQLENSEIKTEQSASQVMVQDGLMSASATATPALPGSEISASVVAPQVSAEDALVSKNSSMEDKTSSQALVPPLSASLPVDSKVSESKVAESKVAEKSTELKTGDGLKQDAADSIKLKFRSDTWIQVKTTDVSL